MHNTSILSLPVPPTALDRKRKAPSTHKGRIAGSSRSPTQPISHGEDEVTCLTTTTKRPFTTT